MNKQPLTVEDLELVIRIHQKILKQHSQLLTDLVNTVNDMDARLAKGKGA